MPKYDTKKLLRVLKADNQTLLKHLKKATIKKAKEKDPKNDYTAVEVKAEQYTDYIPVLTGDKPFQSSVHVPLNNMPGSFNVKKVHKSFDTLILKLKIIEGNTFKPTAEAKDLEAFMDKTTDLLWDLKGLKVGIELDDLEHELAFSRTTLEDLIKKRKSKMKPSKYSDELIKITKHLIEWWINTTGYNKRVNAYSKGDTYTKEYKGKPKSIDVKYNPSGAFIQRTLKTYFKQDFHNRQLATLISKAYNI
jgi:hypothetical protein